MSALDELDATTLRQILIHRAWAQHAAFDTCDECPLVPCRHCDDWSPPGEDHSCPCPHPDETCPDHPIATREGLGE